MINKSNFMYYVSDISQLKDVSFNRLTGEQWKCSSNDCK
jgi:hypothetical protein